MLITGQAAPPLLGTIGPWVWRNNSIFLAHFGKKIKANTDWIVRISGRISDPENRREFGSVAGQMPIHLFIKHAMIVWPLAA